jgi:hypothetical protein
MEENDNTQTQAETEPQGVTEVAEGDGDKSENPTLIETANQSAERLENVLKSLKDENDRTERLQGQARLMGRTPGPPQEEKPKEETPKEYKDRVMRGEL